MTINQATSVTIADLWSQVEPELERACALEEGAQALATALFRSFEESVVLARVFVTTPMGQLPGANQQLVRRVATSAGLLSSLNDSVPVLSLVGTYGHEPAWQDRRQSRAHAGIPLISNAFVDGIPMISRLLKEMGVPMEWVDSHDPDVLVHAMSSSVGLFFVENASQASDLQGRRIIPDQDFVARYGVNGVFGTGAVYPSGAIAVLVVFCRETLSRAAAERFVPLMRLFIAKTERLVEPVKVFAMQTWLESAAAAQQLALLDTLFDGVYVTDASRRIVFWNQGAERITGYGQHEVIGRHCGDNVLNHLDEHGTLMCQGACPASDAIRDGTSRTAKVFVLHKSGRRVPVQTNVAPVRDDTGRVVAAIEVFRDISREEDLRIVQEKFERLIGQYVSTATLEAVQSQARSDEKNAVEERDATIMYVDVVGFTSFAEQHAPSAVVQMLNDVFSCCEEAVRQWQGDVDKVIGDKLMAVFPDANDAVRAGTAILADMLPAMNRARTSLGHAPMSVRIGINSGLVLEGNIGGASRKDRTVIGDPVNLAERITSAAEPDVLWISEATWSRLSDAARFEPDSVIAVKGKQQRVRVFRQRLAREVQGNDGGAQGVGRLREVARGSRWALPWMASLGLSTWRVTSAGARSVLSLAHHRPGKEDPGAADNRGCGPVGHSERLLHGAG